MNITVVYSLPTSQVASGPFLVTEEDTQESAVEVAQALESKGAVVTLLPLTEDGLESLRTIKADCIFNLIEWTGLDLPLAIAAIKRLETLGIPITGASSDHYELTTDKIQLKKALDAQHFPTALWQPFYTGNEAIRPDMPYPALVKPSLEHCSIGISKLSIVHDKAELRNVVQTHIARFRQPVYAEEFILGEEFQITLIEEEGLVTMLPPAQITFDSKDPLSLLSYESRWTEEHDEFKRSHVQRAVLHSQIESQLSAVSKKLFHVFGYRDYARLDIKVHNGVMYILEANSNPGLGDSDDYGMTVSYKAAGLTFPDVVWKIVVSAMKWNKLCVQ